MADITFCAEPAGYSERAYGDAVILPGHVVNDSELTGWHVLDSANCRVRYYWPRNGTNGPSYARVDMSARTTSRPDHRFTFSGSWDIGDFSWGAGSIGIGSPGTGHAFLTSPCIYVQLTADGDLGTNRYAGKFRGVFVNNAGTTFATDWTTLAPQTVSGTLATSVPSQTIRQHVNGSTGYVVLDDGTTYSVALSGSFSGPYSRWESHHGGGGGDSSNLGGTGEGDQIATGEITSVRIDLGGPTTGFIGFGTF